MFSREWFDALVSLVNWNGAGDPPGDWIKQKGAPVRGGERHNPALYDVVGYNDNGREHAIRKVRGWQDLEGAKSS